MAHVRQAGSAEPRLAFPSRFNRCFPFSSRLSCRTVLGPQEVSCLQSFCASTLPPSCISVLSSSRSSALSISLRLTFLSASFLRTCSPFFALRPCTPFFVLLRSSYPVLRVPLPSPSQPRPGAFGPRLHGNATTSERDGCRKKGHRARISRKGGRRSNVHQLPLPLALGEKGERPVRILLREQYAHDNARSTLIHCARRGAGGMSEKVERRHDHRRRKVCLFFCRSYVSYPRFGCPPFVCL